MIKVAIASGGTGGHIYPALALVDWLEEHLPGVETSFFVSRSERCRRMMGGYKGVVRYMGMSGLPTRPSPRTLLFAWSLLKGIVLGMVYLVRARPSVVLGMGGYGSAPLVLAARVLGLPTLIHEQNLIPGRANALLSRFADRVALSFPSTPDCIDGRKVIVTGNPVRRNIGQWTREEARDRLGLDAERFTILAVGGSRGARFINECAVSCASALSPDRFQWVHLAGDEDYEWVSRSYREKGLTHYCAPYLDEIGIAYGASDVALCRAGATTIAELARCGLPALFIPYPFAVGSHQSLNARFLVERGAAVLLEQGEAFPDKVGEVISGLQADSERLSEMRRSMEGIFERNACGKLAEAVMEIASKNRKDEASVDRFGGSG